MPHPDLLAHDAQTRRDIIELAPGVWTSVGFAASNVHLVEGENSVTIIDTSESTRAAETILGEFQRRCAKPVGRIIYTHSHRDHICGASVFSNGAIPIFACHLFKSDLIDTNPDQIAPDKALGRRTLAQFGIGLSPEERISLGCGPGNRPMEGLGAGYLPPTEWIADDTAVDLDGVRAELKLVPGETEDHMVVYLPEREILFCGDNWYHAFPNLYAIRGTPYRDFAAWAKGLGLLRNLNAKVLAPGHTKPVFGTDAVEEVLSTTQAAIFHVMRLTADGMNEGLPLDDIVAAAELPAELAGKPWLKEFYGKLGWSIRAYASGTLGWYDGNPTNLGSLSTRQKALHMAELAGGKEALQRTAESTDDPQWRLELCDHLIALGISAHGLKADTLRQLAEMEINAPARNTYLWEAKRLSEDNQ